MQNSNAQSNAGLRRLASMKVLGIALLTLIMVILGLSVLSSKPQGEFIAYNQLEEMLKKGNTEQITRVIVTKGDSIIRLKIAGTEGMSSVIVPETARESLINELSNAAVPLDIREQNKSNFWVLTEFVLLAIALLVSVVLVFKSIRVLILKAQ
jgi:ATP-dependent Zn protease